VRGEEPALVEALKMRALPESSCDRLFEFLRLYRDAVQMVVDKIWGINVRGCPRGNYIGCSTAT
jgi:hypothetical protein